MAFRCHGLIMRIRTNTALLLHMRVVGLVSRSLIRIRANMHYFRLMYHVVEQEEQPGAALLLPDPDHPWYEKYEDNIPGFDTVHELIYEKLAKTDLRGMKQGAGKKGKGSATRTSKKVSN